MVGCLRAGAGIRERGEGDAVSKYESTLMVNGERGLNKTREGRKIEWGGKGSSQGKGEKESRRRVVG